MDKIETPKNDAIKTRNYEFISYVDPSRITELFRGAIHYCWICHDKDVKEDGTPKEKHWHTVVVFSNPRYESAMFKRARQFSEEHGTNVLVQAKNDIRRALLYLTHESEKALAEGKTLYDTSLLSCDDMSWYNTMIDNGEIGSFSMIHFLRDNLTCTPFENAIKYGRDYMKNFTKYRDFIRICIDDANGDIDSMLAILDGSQNRLGAEIEVRTAIDAINGGDC